MILFFDFLAVSFWFIAIWVGLIPWNNPTLANWAIGILGFGFFFLLAFLCVVNATLLQRKKLAKEKEKHISMRLKNKIKELENGKF